MFCSSYNLSFVCTIPDSGLNRPQAGSVCTEIIHIAFVFAIFELHLQLFLFFFYSPDGTNSMSPAKLLFLVSVPAYPNYISFGCNRGFSKWLDERTRWASGAVSLMREIDVMVGLAIYSDDNPCELPYMAGLGLPRFVDSMSSIAYRAVSASMGRFKKPLIPFPGLMIL